MIVLDEFFFSTLVCIMQSIWSLQEWLLCPLLLHMCACFESLNAYRYRKENGITKTTSHCALDINATDEPIHSIPNNVPEHTNEMSDFAISVNGTLMHTFLVSVVQTTSNKYP